MSLNTWRNIYIILLDDSSCLSRVILIWNCGSTGYEVYWVPHYVREDESYSVSRLSCSRRGWDLQCEQAQLQQAGHPPSQQTASSSLCSAPWFQPQPYSGTSSHSISPGVEGSLHYLFTLRFIQFQTATFPTMNTIVRFPPFPCDEPSTKPRPNNFPAMNALVRFIWFVEMNSSELQSCKWLHLHPLGLHLFRDFLTKNRKEFWNNLSDS